MKGLTREQWAEKLAAIGAYLKGKGAEITIEVIGPWPAIESGMPGRTSGDLNIWLSNSRFDRTLLREACLSAGLDFDPIGEVDRPYLQLVSQGIVHVPKHKPRPAAIFGGPILVTPPPAALIASKLVRASPKDFDDMVFLKQKFRVSTEEVAKYVKAIADKTARTTAHENIVYLEFHVPGSDARTAKGSNAKGAKRRSRSR
jgi:hypothetical protein